MAVPWAQVPRFLEALRDHFGKYGHVMDAVVMSKHSRPRGQLRLCLVDSHRSVTFGNHLPKFGCSRHELSFGADMRVHVHCQPCSAQAANFGKRHSVTLHPPCFRLRMRVLMCGVCPSAYADSCLAKFSCSALLCCSRVHTSWAQRSSQFGSPRDALAALGWAATSKRPAGFPRTARGSALPRFLANIGTRPSPEQFAVSVRGRQRRSGGLLRSSESGHSLGRYGGTRLSSCACCA